jgi:putative Mg2+ transporter-C (MgtC) family protein
MNISGLTTSASIWASSAIGVLVGVGFYSAAILLTLLSAGLMMWASKLEGLLPSRPALALTLRFRHGFVPVQATLAKVAGERGYFLAPGSLSARMSEGRQEWRFVAIETDHQKARSLTELANELAAFDGIDSFEISHARN